MEQSEVGSPELQKPNQVIAARVRELRRARGWTADQLAEQMKAAGFSWSRIVVTKLETGRRPAVSVEEFLALAYVLDVAPVHLLVPPNTLDARYQVTPDGVEADPDEVRAWIRGQRPIGLVSPRRYFAEVPDVEWVPPKPPRPGTDGVERAATAADIPALRAFVAERVSAGLDPEQGRRMTAAIDRLADQLGGGDGER